jgi:hypothetical protein
MQWQLWVNDKYFAYSEGTLRSWEKTVTHVCQYYFGIAAPYDVAIFEGHSSCKFSSRLLGIYQVACQHD